VRPRRRRRRSRPTEGESLDAFLDIVTNSLGLLILVACLNAGASEGLAIELGQPLMREPDPALDRFVFDCRRGRVAPVDPAVTALLEKRLFASGTPSAARVRQLDAERVRTPWHRYRCVQLDPETGAAAVRLELRAGAGDALADLDDPGGAFRSALDALDPAEDWLLFATGPDSFEVMRAARRIALARGFQVGWWPLDAEEGLGFARGGVQPGTD